MALDTIAFRPRVLRDVSNVDATTEVLGRKLRLPIVLCPVGSLESFHRAAPSRWSRRPGEFGVAHMLSSVCDPGLEDVAKAAPDALRMFQLYVRGDAAWVDDHVERAIASKYTAFCLTVDTAHYSRRERDIAKRHITAGRRRATGPRIPGRPRLAHGRPHQEQVQNPARHQRRSDCARTPSSRSITASSLSTSPITAAGNSITAAVRWMFCRKSSRRSPAAPPLSSTVVFIAAAISSRRWRWAPTWSASAACSATRWRRRGGPASCACWRCWRTKSRAPWGCSASRASARSTSPICTRRRRANPPHVFSAFPHLQHRAVSLLGGAIIVRYEILDRTARIAIDRPPVNALTLDMIRAVVAALRRAAADRGVRAVVLTSGIARHFCAGLDIALLLGKSGEEVREFLQALYVDLHDSQVRSRQSPRSRRLAEPHAAAV